MEDLSEKEQLDALRVWWAENGSYVMGGIIVGIVVIFGWNRWQTGVAETEIAASSLFEDVMDAAARGNLDAATVAADDLFSGYDDTPYAAQARLAMARLYMDNGRDQDAADVLSALVDSAPDSELTLVARLRLAKIFLYQDKAQDVVDLVKGMPASAFAARFNEVLGDAYVMLGSYAEAEAAYIVAMNDDPAVQTVDVSLIQLKINDLPLLTEATPVEPESDEPADAVEESAEPAAENSAPQDPPVEDADDGEPEEE